MSANTTAGLNRGKNSGTYCDGIGCNASTRGALNLARLGFTLKELLGGLDCGGSGTVMARKKAATVQRAAVRTAPVRETGSTGGVIPLLEESKNILSFIPALIKHDHIGTAVIKIAGIVVNPLHTA